LDPTGLKPEEKVSCGPDVTDWFLHEIELFRAAAKKANDDFSAGIDKASDLAEADGHFLAFMTVFARLARLADYKDRTKFGVEPFDYSKCPDPDKNSVTLCGVCIGTNQLGNIMLGIIAAEMRMVSESRKFGRGEKNDNLLNRLLGVIQQVPWTQDGEMYRQWAFELGADYESEVIRTGYGYINFCKYVKARAASLNGKQYNTNASTKCPCDHKHTGPNTDMNREPITDPGGNSIK
jgi:hypothetical protein